MSPADTLRWAFADDTPHDIAAVAAPVTHGMCRDCRQWTHGHLIRHIEAASGPGVAIVTHDNSQCPGKRP